MSLGNAAPQAQPGQTVVSGPERVRSEHWWRVRLSDGTECILARLLPELAADESVRRRYVRDAERRAAIDAPGLAPVLAIGPQPDPRDPAADPPWRLRVDPSGERLSDWLDRRAPAPADEVLELVASLADVAAGVHDGGVVMRDLEPRNVVIGDEGGGLTLTDIGLARVDILSTRSASSLMLESSPYAAPEHMRATVLDHRADIFTLGAIAWHALTGVVPFSEGPTLFREHAPLPPLAELGVTMSSDIESLLVSCLAQDPEARPQSARDVAAGLRGEAVAETALAVRVVCQACGEPMRPGLRLCLACGKEAVQFRHRDPGSADKVYRVVLIKATEDAEFVAKLRAFFENVGEGPVPELNFLIGDARMYSKEERARLHKLPATLITDLAEETARRLAAKLEADGFKVRAEPIKADANQRRGSRYLVAGAVTGVAGIGFLGAGIIPLGVTAVVLGGAFAIIGGIRSLRRRKPKTPALAGLRAAPAALPASDPLVARLGALLADDLATDARERVSDIALLVQRLVDHRGRLADDDGEMSLITAPLEPLVDLVCHQVQAVSQCDAALTELDEGTLVRAIATSEARREPRSRRVELLTGLDRLRDLEDHRAAHMQNLLEASSLIRRAVELGLSHHDDDAESRRLEAMALAALEN